MPELKHEIPSEQELRSYFLECRPWIGHTKLEDDYDLPDINEAYYRYGGAELRAKIGEVIWNALNRLNAVDRRDSFWAGTNRRPTMMKIFDYAKRRIQEDPTAEDELWVLAVSDSYYGSNDFGQEWWNQLWRLGRLDIRWPIRAGLWNEMMLGFGPHAMVRLLRELGSPAEACPVLNELADAADPRLQKWAADVIAGTYNC